MDRRTQNRVDYESTLAKLDTPDIRVFASMPWAPCKSALCLFLILITYYLVIVALYHWVSLPTAFSAEYPFWMEFDTVFVISALHGYIYASEIYQRRGAIKDIEDLRDHVRPSATPSDLKPIERKLITRSRWAAVLGFVAGLIYLAFFSGSGSVLITQGEIQPFLLFGAVSFPLLFANMGLHVVTLSNAPLALFMHQFRDNIEIDVFDRHAYRPFVSLGLRAALRWLILFAILMVLLLDEGNNRTIFGSLPMILVMMGMAALLATYEFIAPLFSARNLIIREKSKELEWVIEDIKRERTALQTNKESSASSARLPGLLAYKREVDSLPDWPVDSPDIGRFIIYLLIPAISWFGAAGTQVLVETIVR